MSTGIQGITEADIADYLANAPAFFERHAELLGSIRLASPHGPRAVSLQERQVELLRERIKGLENRIMDMIRHGQENVAIADRLHRWTRAVMLVERATDLPEVLLGEMKQQFLVPQAGLRLWGVDAAHAGQPWAAGASADARAFACSLALPWCGPESVFEPVSWLEESATIRSVALVPLRHGRAAGAGGCFGLLVLGSPDPQRFEAGMATDLLERIAELASAALSRLRPR